MTSRNVAARIIKLEARRQRPNEMLLIWRRPDDDVKAAMAGATFAPGDRVICVEWFGREPLPGPTWHGDRLNWRRDSIESDYVYKSMGRQVAGPRDPGFADLPSISEDRARLLPDSELLYMIFGVAT